MEETRPAHVLPVPRWTMIFHIVQVVLAIVILGLDAYGIRWIAYNALIYSLVVAICTIGVGAYLLISQLFLHQIYNMYVVLGLHAWMLLFWIIDLGLVANLASLWSGKHYYSSGSSSCYSYYGYTYCVRRRDLYRREEFTTYQAYYGALAAGAFFAAVEFGTFVASTVILVLYMNKHRSATAAAQATQASHAPPQYVDTTVNSQGPAVPMEKYNHVQPPQQYQQPYTAVSTPQQTYAQPVQGQYAQQPVTYQPEPINRANTVSPVSHVGGYGNASELQSPQHTGAYNPNASELGGNSVPHHTPDVPELSSK